ncbi:MAG: glycosyltransferase [Eubacteriales bacterium]|nr:glycosyltransferase [Eubacteriales bacterium]
MEENKLHTFVIMAYKNAPYIEETIQSILKQSYKSEVCMSTSTPNERIQAIAQQFNLPLFVNQPGQGIAADWTFALRCAKTPLVTLADQDDIYDPSFSDRMVQQLNKYPDMIVGFTHFKEIDSDRHVRPLNLTMAVKNILMIPYFIRSHFKSRFFKRLVFHFGEPICNPSVTYNMAVIGEHNLFDETYSVSLDWDALLRLTEIKGHFCFIKQPLILHGIHTGTQTSFGIVNGKRYEEDYRIMVRVWPKWLAKWMTDAYAWSYRSNH